jgi:hypothetical protein
MIRNTVNVLRIVYYSHSGGIWQAVTEEIAKINLFLFSRRTKAL